MDWFMVTCGGAAVYAAGRWLHGRMQGAKGKGLFPHRRGIPLKAVVANCEAKWFLQELQQAMSGDHTAMVRVSHMLLVGYGTRQDQAAAASWMRKAWALQNFKEPADAYLQHDMLDLRNSDIPALNDPHDTAANSSPSEAEPAASQQLHHHIAAASEPLRAAAALRRRTRHSGSNGSTAGQAVEGDVQQEAPSKAGLVDRQQQQQQRPPRAQPDLGCGFTSSSSSNGSAGAGGYSNPKPAGLAVSAPGTKGSRPGSTGHQQQLPAALAATASNTTVHTSHQEDVGAELQQQQQHLPLLANDLLQLATASNKPCPNQQQTSGLPVVLLHMQQQHQPDQPLQQQQQVVQGAIAPKQLSCFMQRKRHAARPCSSAEPPSACSEEELLPSVDRDAMQCLQLFS